MGLDICYRQTDDGIEIIRCCGSEPVVHLPSELAGNRITRIAPYAFSAYKAEPVTGLHAITGDDRLRDSDRPLAGEWITEIHLPEKLITVGNYAFYGCTGLKKLYMTDSIQEFGTGAFIDCQLSYVQAKHKTGWRSCLKDILEEVKSRIIVDLIKTEAGKQQMARLCFPEYYEEDVENGPARIFEIHYLGSGYKYRQSFTDRQPDYRTYDRLFSAAAANESLAVIYDILQGRLLWPLQLAESAREAYHAFIREQGSALAGEALSRDDQMLLHYIARECLWTRSELEKAVDLAVQSGKAEYVSLLLDVRRRLFPTEKKEFIL